MNSMKYAFLILQLLILPSWVMAEPFAFKEVSDGIYVHLGPSELPDTHNHGSIANIGFIIGDRCVAVVDTGGNPQEGYQLETALKKVTSKPVCYVINTHVHPDHIFGNIAFKKYPGVQFVGHHNLPRAMATRGGFYLERSKEQLGVELKPEHLIAPDIQVKKHLILDLGNRRITLTAHPTAHTDNDLTVLDQKTGVLWMSDLLFREHLPVIDGSIKGWLSELQRMEKQHYAVVIPGHGEPVYNWPQGMQAEKRYLEIVIKEVRQMIRQGRFLEEAVDEVGYSEQSRWKLFDQFHKKNVTTAFAELEWE